MGNRGSTKKPEVISLDGLFLAPSFTRISRRFVPFRDVSDRREGSDKMRDESRNEPTKGTIRAEQGETGGKGG